LRKAAGSYGEHMDQGDGIDIPGAPGYGKVFALGDDTPFRHRKSWEREPTRRRERLRIGGGDDPVELLVALAQLLVEPLYVLAVINVPFAGNGAKYESQALTHAGVGSFFDDFGTLFSDDGRADAWVGSMHDEGLIVLDENDLLYAYGPLDEFERMLRDRGFTVEWPLLPSPHVHNFNEELNSEEARLRGWSGWSRVLPLEDDN
jgi:hypothetical protein